MKADFIKTLLMEKENKKAMVIPLKVIILMAERQKGH